MSRYATFTLNPALATLLDNSFDSLVDTAFGKFREQSKSNETGSGRLGAAWSKDERFAYGSGTATSLDESQVAVDSAYLKMSR